MNDYPTNGAAAHPLTVNPDAERLTIAAMILDPDLVLVARDRHGLTPAEYRDSGYALVFEVLCGLVSQGMIVDTTTIIDELMKRGVPYSEANGLSLTHTSAGLMTLDEAVFEMHVRQVKTAAARRLVIEQGLPAIYERVAAIEDPAQMQAAALEIIKGLPIHERPGDDGDDADPLAVTPSPSLALGWIDDYAALMTRLTGSPFEFNRVCGLVTAAAAIQRRAVLHMAFGDIFPNIYAAIIARSSVYHKSSALSKPRSILRRAMLDRLLLSELATSEGLLKQLATQGSGLIIRDEIGTLFSSHNTKYLQNLKPDLTALYDCYPYSRRLSNDAVKVDAPYLSILGATTPARFYEGASFVDWADGFLARWLFVLPQGEPDFDAATSLFTQEQDAEIGRLAVALVNIDRQRETDFVLQGRAHQVWDDWQRNAAKQAYVYGDDVISAVTTRYAAYALKFSIILAAVNDSWGVISEETMLTAIALADSFKGNVHKLLSEKANYGMSGSKLQRVFRVIQRKGGTVGVTRKVIQQHAKIRAGDLTLCIDRMVECGYVYEDTEGRSPRYMALIDRLPVKAWK